MIRTAILAVAALVAGCAAAQPSPERQARLTEMARTIPTCDEATDCAAKWQAAQLWVAQHSPYRIRLVTGALIETYGSNDFQLSMRVFKQPIAPGRSRIAAEAWCGNGFSCLSDPVEALIAFNRDVAGAQP